MAKDEEKYKSYRIAVPIAYQDIFSHFYYAANTSSNTISKTLLPSYQTVLIFNFGAPTVISTIEKTKIEIDKCIVLGPIKQAFAYSLPPNTEILVANFANDAFFRFFGHTLFSERLSANPDDLIDENCFNVLWSELNKIKEPSNRVSFVLDFCPPYLKKKHRIIEQLTTLKDERLSPIKSIASRHQQTERNIQLIHKKHLGYSAKEINRYQRFLKAIELIQKTASNASKIDWFEIIAECGYYDQSQLISDFRKYLNLSPKNYLRFQKDICKAKD